MPIRPEPDKVSKHGQTVPYVHQQKMDPNKLRFPRRKKVRKKCPKEQSA